MAALAVLAGVVLAGEQSPSRAPIDAQLEMVDGAPAVAGEVIVKFRRSLGDDERHQLHRELEAEDDKAIAGATVRRFKSRRHKTPRLLSMLRSHPDVAYAEPNYVVTSDAVPDDSWFGELWGMLNTGQRVGTPGTAGADIRATQAWDISTGSRSTVIAVLDTGIDYFHSDLAANVWSAPAPFTVTVGGRTVTCPAGSHGFNVLTGTCDPFDENGHGTHVSGTIGAVGNNRLGVTGVNWTTSIMVSKFLNVDGVGTLADAINALEFVLQATDRTGANVRVLSNSWRVGGFSQALLDQINRAATRNMLFVASAGNSGTNNDLAPQYPASFNAANLISVAATDNNDALASFSNYGAASVHLAAPGVNILSTTTGDGYQYSSGTSMAAPHVSGAAALLLSACTLTATELKAALLSNVDTVPLLAGRVSTGGRLNVNAAIRECSRPPDFSISAAPATATATDGGAATYTISIKAEAGFNRDVTLSASGVPAGGTASFSP
ncbi:MAG TPA: S8 family peptidase, partial [Vicinamibacterales bacterium]|nr:S8 family peptidase [Vicinamibacterales bacterium]